MNNPYSFIAFGQVAIIISINTDVQKHYRVCGEIFSVQNTSIYHNLCGCGRSMTKHGACTYTST